MSSTGASAGQILKWSGSEWAPAADAGGLDSALTTQLVDSAYVTLRAGGGTDSAAVIQLIDSDYISKRVVSFANPTFTDFKFVTDSAGQIVFEGADYFGETLTFDSHNHSVFVNGIRLLDSDFTADPLINRITLDSTGAVNDEIVISTIAGKNALAGISIIDSDYISQRVIAVANPQFVNYRYIATGGQTAFTGSDVNSKTLSITTDNYSVFLNGIKLLDSDFTANTSSNTITLATGATASDELVVTTVIGQNAVAGIAAVDSAYINARVASGTDSSTVISLINSTVNTAYVTARQSLLDSDLALQLLLDSSEIVQLIDSAYINARVSSVDSAATLAIIDSAHVQSKIPHAYIQARQITYNTSDFLDSTTITGVVDSDYVGLRMSGVIAPKFSNFRYSADSGQTAFTGADMNANTLYLRSGNHSVYVNGVKLIDSDFTSNISTDTITLATGLDSGDELVVTTITGDVIADQSSLIDSDYIQTRIGGVVKPTFTDFRYVADSGQTAFTGADLGGTSLDLRTNNFSVFLNGIKLIDSDFTSNISTNTITLTEAADSGDALIITTLNGDVVTTATAIDSSYVQLRQEGVNAIFKDFKYVATADQTVFSGNDANGAALSFDTEKFHVLLNGIRLDASDFTESASNNRITLASGATVSDEVVISTLSTQRTSTLNAITTTVDSAYVQARQTDIRDSAFVTGIVDSAYIEPLLNPIHISSGSVGIGTGSPADYDDEADNFVIYEAGASGHAGITIANDGNDARGHILFADGTSGSAAYQGAVSYDHADNKLYFRTAAAEVMRIDASGRLLIGATTYDANNKGVYLNGASGKGFFTVSGDAPLAIHRLSSDGDLVELRQDNNTEGTISVSGSTVSYNGFSGQHETSGIATNTAIGTVVSTIDELDTYFSGDKKGQTRADHAKVKISDSAGDGCVYGVVSRFDSDGKAFVASVGIGSVRVTGACAKGDLLESNGDGTAKVQSDDIIRSKTIGKVTIGNSNSGVKLVSCVLYCG